MYRTLNAGDEKLQCELTLLCIFFLSENRCDFKPRNHPINKIIKFKKYKLALPFLPKVLALAFRTKTDEQLSNY